MPSDTSSVVEFSTLPDLFKALVDFHGAGTHPALEYKDRKAGKWVAVSWPEFRERVYAFAAFLLDAGIEKGDRIALLTENRPEWAVADMALQALGAVNVSMYTSLPPSQVEYIVRDSGARLLIVSTSLQLRKAEEIFDRCDDLQRIITMSELRKDRSAHIMTWDEAEAAGRQRSQVHAADVDRARDAVRPSDLSSLIYTSGTTGLPKGVMLTHDNFVSNVKAALQRVPFSPGDSHLSFLPLCHVFERTAGYLCVLAAGGRIAYAESVDTVTRNMGELSPTIMISVPRLFEKAYNIIAKSVEEGTPMKRRIFDWSVRTGSRHAAKTKNGSGPGPFLKLSNRVAQKLVFQRLHDRLGGRLRFAVSGGAALPRSIGEFFEAAGVMLLEGYGLTETSPVLSINPMGHPRYGTVGHVLPGMTVGIMRVSDGEIVGRLTGDDYPSDLTTEEGEIVVKGPNVMGGYWNLPEATAEAIDAAGWYHTGDVGRYVDGYLQITDRIKHMIVSQGGKNIYPGPIEDSFGTDPLIEQISIQGEGRPYLAALVHVAPETVDAFLKARGEARPDSGQIDDIETLRGAVELIFKRYNRTAASHEKVRRFHLINEAFTIENGQLTPTLKKRRRQIEEAYRDVIANLYGEEVEPA